MGDDRPSAYYEGDILIIRASAIGGTCLWELVAAAQGYEQSEPPDFLQRAFDMGHELEPVIIRMLEEEGYVITGAQDEGELWISDTVKIRYHPDGYINMPGTGTGGLRRILEVKTMANDSWQRAARGSVGDIFSEYNWQLSVMMHANQEPNMNKYLWPLEPMRALWVAYNKGNADGSECLDEGRLLYEPVVLPPISLDTIRNKALAIEALVMKDDILESGRECDDPSHFPCRFQHLRPEPKRDDTSYRPPGKDA